MSYHEDRIGIAAKLLGMIVSPANGFRHVARHLFDGDLGHKAIVCRDKHKTPIHKCLRFGLDAPLVALPPAAAVNPNDQWMIAARGGSMDVERLTLVLR